MTGARHLQAELVLNCANSHGEGIFWNAADQRIWWTDINGKAVWHYDPVTGQSAGVELPDRLCAFAPRASGGWIMAFAGGIELWSADFTRLSRIHDFEPDKPHTRLNDGRADRDGRFVVGGMNERDGAADSSVVRVNQDLQVETLFDGVACANSTCFSRDGKTMYFADSPRRCIEALDYDDSSNPSRILAETDGIPDGSCVDAQSGVWNAVWEGGEVVRYDAAGEMTHRVSVPVPRVTCCAFGGKDMDTLFITTSRLGADDAELARFPIAGALFAVRPGFTGLQDKAFAG